MTNNFIYTGIGSRETPHEIKETFIKLGIFFGKRGYTLRSGGAGGADEAFEIGCDIEYGRKEIYLPWQNFNNNESPLYKVSDSALYIAKYYHPNWDNLSDPVKKIMGRNVHQVLGYDLETPTDFIVCYTKNDKNQGGTGQALRIAYDRTIPIIDFRKKEAKELLNETVREIKRVRSLF